MVQVVQQSLCSFQANWIQEKEEEQKATISSYSSQIQKSDVVNDEMRTLSLCKIHA